MIPLPPATWIYLACCATDMRKGFDGAAVLVQQVLEQISLAGRSVRTANSSIRPVVKRERDLRLASRCAPPGAVSTARLTPR